AASGRAGVERPTAAHVDGEARQRGGQLLAAAGDEARCLAGQLDRLPPPHQSGRGLGGAPGDADASGGDRLHRLAAAPEQPTAHELGIESPAHWPRRRICRRGSGAVTVTVTVTVTATSPAPTGPAR